LKRPDARDALPLEPQRHPGARCLVGSGAVQYDLPVARHLVMSLIDLLRGNPYRAPDRIRRRIDLERRARVDDRQIAVSSIEPALELVGRDARYPETSEESLSLDELDGDALSREEAGKRFMLENRPTSLIARFIESKEIADFVTYVSSPLSSAINGAALRIDGGLVRSVL